MGKLLTVIEAMQRLRCSRSTFYKLIKQGKFKIKKMGKKTLIDSDEIEKYIDSITVEYPTTSRQA